MDVYVLLIYEYVRMVPGSWYDVVKCVDNL